MTAKRRSTTFCPTPSSLPPEIDSAEIIGGLGTRSYIIQLKGKDWKPSTGCAGNAASAVHNAAGGKVSTFSRNRPAI
jgi:hypothetical protein